MTSDEVKQSIAAWCTSDGDLEFAGERFEPSTDFAANVRAGVTSGAPVELTVLQGQGADRVTLRHVASLSSGSADAATALLDARPGWVTGTVERGATGTSVTAQTYVYLDGLNRHTFTQAAAELARTGRLLGKLATGAAAAATTAQPAYTSAVPSYQPLSTQPSASQMAAPSFSTQPQTQPVAAAQPMQQGPAPWQPTHAVPPQGLRAWAAPDPAGPVVANLAPGLPIQVSEVRGAWARVICSNGWAGWIDGRIIGVAA